MKTRSGSEVIFDMGIDMNKEQILELWNWKSRKKSQCKFFSRDDRSQELLWSFVHGSYEASDTSQTINSSGEKKLKLLYQYPVEIKQEKVFALPKNISLSETTLLLEKQSQGTVRTILLCKEKKFYHWR